MATKAVLNNVGKALSIQNETVSKISKLISNESTIAKALSSSELKREYKSDSKIKNIIDIAQHLEGLPKYISTHAAGIVICPNPVESYVPILLTEEGIISTQYIMTTLEELGILKIDILGLRTLTVIKKCLQSIKEKYNKNITFGNYDDVNVYNYIGSGETNGIFQLESLGMKKFMKELKPNNFEDIIAGISLYRPGPISYIPKYIKAKNSGIISYICKELEPILKATYGCVIYQEQVMQIVQTLAGYTMAQSDNIRRAMSKKQQNVIDSERQNFIFGSDGIKGCVANGINSEIANKIYDSMVDFAKYAFNKSHAAAYAVISYQTAYLKYYYSIEYFAALMSSVKDNIDKTAEYLSQSKQLNIMVHKPDIIYGDIDFIVRENSIVYSLASIRNVGKECVNQIISERKKQPFQNFKDFIIRMIQNPNFNKLVIESLIKSGALDSLGHTRKFMLQEYPKILNYSIYEKKHNVLGQTSLFDLSSIYSKKKKEEEFHFSEILSFEKEVLGIYLSGHALEEDYLQWKTGISATSLDFSNIIFLNEKVTIGGIITNIVTKQTKNNQTMAFLLLEDLYGSIEIVVFPEQYVCYKSLLQQADEKIFCTGIVKNCKLLLEKIMPFSKHLSNIWIQFSDEIIYNSSIKQLEYLLSLYPGNQYVNLYLKNIKKIKKLTNQQVYINENLICSLIDIFGKENIKLT